MRKRIFALALPVLLLAGTAAQAHKMKLFASAAGPEIEGYVYFSPGGRAHQVGVTVSAADGAVLGRLQTDDDGAFRFEAKSRIDHVFSADGGDGHEASYTVSAGDLPPSLPGGAGGSVVTAPDASRLAAGTPIGGEDGLRAFIDQSVARQIRPLREQLDAYQEKIWMHDVLGGLGVIFGLGGVAFGLSERRRRMGAS